MQDSWVRANTSRTWSSGSFWAPPRSGDYGFVWDGQVWRWEEGCAVLSPSVHAGAHHTAWCQPVKHKHSSDWSNILHRLLSTAIKIAQH